MESTGDIYPNNWDERCWTTERHVETCFTVADVVKYWANEEQANEEEKKAFAMVFMCVVCVHRGTVLLLILYGGPFMCICVSTSKAIKDSCVAFAACFPFLSLHSLETNMILLLFLHFLIFHRRCERETQKLIFYGFVQLVNLCVSNCMAPVKA